MTDFTRIDWFKIRPHVETCWNFLRIRSSVRVPERSAGGSVAEGFFPPSLVLDSSLWVRTWAVPCGQPPVGSIGADHRWIDPRAAAAEVSDGGVRAKVDICVTSDLPGQPQVPPFVFACLVTWRRIWQQRVLVIGGSSTLLKLHKHSADSWGCFVCVRDAPRTEARPLTLLVCSPVCRQVVRLFVSTQVAQPVCSTNWQYLLGGICCSSRTSYPVVKEVRFSELNVHFLLGSSAVCVQARSSPVWTHVN